MGVQQGSGEVVEGHDFARLIDRFREGDRRAGGHLETKVRSLLSSHIRRSGVRAQETEELVQEGILQVFSRLHEFREVRGRFESWITGFAMNVVRKHRRLHSRVLTNTVSEDDSPLLSYEIDPGRHEQEPLEQALATLEQLDRELLHKRFSLGMTSEEIAAEGKMTSAQIRKRISRAMERLRRHPAVLHLNS